MERYRDFFATLASVVAPISFFTGYVYINEYFRHLTLYVSYLNITVNEVAWYTYFVLYSVAVSLNIYFYIMVIGCGFLVFFLLNYRVSFVAKPVNYVVTFTLVTLVVHILSAAIGYSHARYVACGGGKAVTIVDLKAVGSSVSASEKAAADNFAAANLAGKLRKIYETKDHLYLARVADNKRECEDEKWNPKIYELKKSDFLFSVSRSISY